VRTNRFESQNPKRKFRIEVRYAAVRTNCKAARPSTSHGLQRWPGGV